MSFWSIFSNCFILCYGGVKILVRPCWFIDNPGCLQGAGPLVKKNQVGFSRIQG